MTTLQESITKKISKLNNSDPLWVTFVNDYIFLIKANADVIEISDADRDRFQNKLIHFLREKNYDSEITWIILLINELNIYDDFTLRNYLYIPTMNYITKLYRQYQTSNNIITD